MMLALLVYCYATGRFGPRTIAAATHRDVAVRYLCANHCAWWAKRDRAGKK